MIAGCDLLDMDYKPSAEQLRASTSVADLIVAPMHIEGIYGNVDVDSLVFRYTPARPIDQAWSTITVQASCAGWTLQNESPQRLVLRRVRVGGAFPSTEQVRICRTTQDIVVGYVQVDHLHEKGCHRWSEDRFAENTLWPIFEQAVSE